LEFVLAPVVSRAMTSDRPPVTDPAGRPLQPQRGRAALSNGDGRFEPYAHEPVDDGWGTLDEPLAPRATAVADDPARSVISRNDSPDIPFEQSLNPYRGCEHGCIYCYARPSHAYLGHSPGLDFETRLYAKHHAARRLEAELARPGYRVAPIALGSNTDCYQPIERRLRITRAVLEVLARCRHPVSIVTKSALIERDLDLLAPMAAQGLAAVFVSVTTLDRALARRLEPRAAAPERRLATLARLAAAGVPVGVMFAPAIPALNDAEMEAVLERAAAAGARHAGYVLLRLPHELRQLFTEWLEVHAPLKAAHVLARLREARGGRLYDAGFGRRMTGRGEYAAMLGRRFDLACRRLGLNRGSLALDGARFRAPGGAQLALFASP
jgi:DNA repair photolyase